MVQQRETLVWQEQGVLQGDRGECMGGFMEQMGCCSAVKAEIRAVL